MKTFTISNINPIYISQKKDYESSKIIALEGDTCNQVGYITKGQISLVHYSLQGDEKRLALLGKGDFFGGFLLHASQNTYPGCLIALESTSIVYFSKKNLDALLKENDHFRDYYLKNLCEKATRLNLHNKILSQSSLEDKIMYYIEHSLTSGKSEIRIQSKTELAKYLNATRPSLSRALAALKKRGVIDYNRHSIKLLTTSCSLLNKP